MVNILTEPVNLQPSRELYDAVRAAFVKQGTSLNAWCIANGMPRSRAVQALFGLSIGPEYEEARRTICEAVGLSGSESA